MKRGLLAIAGLLGLSAGLAYADYVILITNLGEKNEGAPGMGPRDGPGPRPGPGPGPRPGMGEDMGDNEKELGANAILVTAIVEVTPPRLLTKAVTEQFDNPAVLQMKKVKHPWGMTTLTSWKAFEQAGNKDLEVAAAFRVDNDYHSIPPLSRRYSSQHDEVFKGAHPDPQKVLDLARWCLEHGLIKEFAEVMGKLDKPEDQKIEAVAAYQDLKRRLGERLKEPSTAKFTRALENLDKDSSSNFFLVLYPAEAVSTGQLKARISRLEDCFKAFYYWYALQGLKPPLPKEKLVVVLQTEAAKFKHLETILGPAPRVADGFFARRENVAVLSLLPLSNEYDLLLKKSDTLWQNKFNRTAILHGQSEMAGMPYGATNIQQANARGYALMLKALEVDSEIASTSHAVARQLVYASGVLPRNVNAPEWLQFGLASFFESPAGSPWPSYTAPSHLYWPAFRELREGKKDLRLEATPLETLKRVVTDGYFREEGQTPADRAARLHRARATAWALTYFLMQRDLAGLERFNKELARMPRDLALDGEVVWACFARAFHEDKLKELAGRWYDNMRELTLESEELAKNVEALKEKVKKIVPAEAPGMGNPMGPRPRD